MKAMRSLYSFTGCRYYMLTAYLTHRLQWLKLDLICGGADRNVHITLYILKNMSAPYIIFYFLSQARAQHRQDGTGLGR